MKIGVVSPVMIDILKDQLFEQYHPMISRIKGIGGSQVPLLVKEYLNRGHQVSVYTLDLRVDAGKEIVLEGPRLKIFVGPWRRGKRVTLDFQSVERKFLTRLMLSDNPDVIHAHWTYEFAQAAIACGLPHLITVRDWAPKILAFTRSTYGVPSIYRFMRLIMNHKILRSGSVFTANSPYIAQKLKRYYNIDAQVVPNGIEDKLFIAEKKEFNQTKPVIISINNGFGKLKNTKTLISAFAKLQKQVSYKPNLRMIGSGFENDGEAYRWAQEQGLGDGIEFIGPLPRTEVINALREADLMVHPALEESFGNTLVEAMANKVPVIAGLRSGAVPWVLSGGETGRLVDVTSDDAIAEAMMEILESDQKRSHYAGEGFKRASDTFRISQVASQYEEIFAKIV